MISYKTEKLINLRKSKVAALLMAKMTLKYETIDKGSLIDLPKVGPLLTGNLENTYIGVELLLSIVAVDGFCLYMLEEDDLIDKIVWLLTNSADSFVLVVL